jgi:hypothetical protein
MTQRDLEIISMVYAYEGCGIEHIRQLFFQGAALRSIPCYRRLAYLVKQGYLQSVKLSALNKHFLTPGAKARSLLSHLLKGSEVKRIRIESPLLILLNWQSVMSGWRWKLRVRYLPCSLSLSG